MTLDECYAANQGKALLIPGGGAGNEGQCVQWADTVLHDVYGQPYHWGNAIDWWNSPGELLDHFDKVTDGSVKKGDFVIFNTKVGSPYGHIDVAAADGTTADFQGYDSNWSGNKTVHQVHHVGSQYVLGSLRFKRKEEEMIDLNAARLLCRLAFYHEPADDSFTSQLVGKDIFTAIQMIEALPERRNLTNLINSKSTTPDATVLKPGVYKVEG